MVWIWRNSAKSQEQIIPSSLYGSENNYGLLNNSGVILMDISSAEMVNMQLIQRWLPVLVS